MFRNSISLALLCAAVAFPIGAFSDTLGADSGTHGATLSSTSNPVIQWNKTLLTIVRTPGAQSPTVHATHSFALMHAAIYDAVNSIDRSHQPYLIMASAVSDHASRDAAAAAAAHEVLVTLYPTFQVTLDAQLSNSLAQVPDGPGKRAGVSVGRNVADYILAIRNADGSGAEPITYVFGTAPGDYQSTPPNFPAQPVFTHWSHVTPFALEFASQFRPGPPPALTSEAYTDAFNEVKAVGVAHSTAATADQALTGLFWNGAIQNYWNEIAQTAAQSRQLTTTQSARLFALLNLTLADGVIAFYDAKYTYNFWRPVTAIRAADLDANPETLRDPAWLPEAGKTAPDPSYPGAHAVISAGGAAVLKSYFRRSRMPFTVTSESLPGVARSFETFMAAATEASLSRVYAGVHFRSDEVAGERLGRAVADFVLDHFLTPVDSEEGGD